MIVNTIKPFSDLNKYEKWKSKWVDQDGVDIFSYVSEMCHPEDVLLFCRLLLPDFVLVDGAVLLQSKYDDDIFRSWLNKFNGDTNKVEEIINHTHLYDVFGGCKGAVEDAIFEQLSEVIALSWRLVLKEKFPEKKFFVESSNSDQDYGPVVTFYQVTK